MYQSFDLTV